MADIIKFEPKPPVKRPGENTIGPSVLDTSKIGPKDPIANMVISCHCGCVLHELLNAGVVVCSRCRCRAPAVWQWDRDSPTLPPTRPAA